MDITVILPPTNKAGISLVKILKDDNKEKEFKKIVKYITHYNEINKHLLSQNVTLQYVYDVVYKDYINKIKNAFIQKYSDYILNILHTKYIDHLNELQTLLSINENNANENDVENNANENDVENYDFEDYFE